MIGLTMIDMLLLKLYCMRIRGDLLMGFFLSGEQFPSPKPWYKAIICLVGCLSPVASPGVHCAAHWFSLSRLATSTHARFHPLLCFTDDMEMYATHNIIRGGWDFTCGGCDLRRLEAKCRGSKLDFNPT